MTKKLVLLTSALVIFSVLLFSGYSAAGEVDDVRRAIQMRGARF